MAYTLDIGLALGTGKAGLNDLHAQLVNTSGEAVGSAISTGFTEIGQGNYLWHCTTLPDNHRGGVRFYSAATPGTVLAFGAINPEDSELVAIIESQTDDIGVAGAGLTAINLPDQTMNITGNLSGSVGSVAAGGITAATLANDTITAATLAADVTTELQAGLATAAELAKVPKSDSNVTWNATALASMQQEATDALNAYDPPTATELTDALAALNDITVADIIAGVSEGVLDLQEILRIILAAVAGKASGGGTATIKFRDQADAKDRIIAWVDVNGNRTSVTVDGS